MPRKIKNIAYIIVTCWFRRVFFSSCTSLIDSMLDASEFMVSSMLPPDLFACPIIMIERTISLLFLILFEKFFSTVSSGMFQLSWLLIFFNSFVR